MEVNKTLPRSLTVFEEKIVVTVVELEFFYQTSFAVFSKVNLCSFFLSAL